MFFLKNLFKRDSGSLVSGLAGLTSATLNTNLGLANLPEQYHALWSLKQQRQQLEIKLGEASRVYQSMILALDVERGLLWLDDLFPQQRILEVGDEITIRHHRNGEELAIRAPILALGANFGASGIAILLPENAVYLPRRKAPRFVTSLNQPIMVKIRAMGNNPCYGRLQDISTGGVRVHIAGNILEQLRHGAILPVCEVELSKELRISCKAKICAYRMNRAPHRHTQISLQFVDLTDHKRDQLNEFLQSHMHSGDKPVIAEHCAA